jgi:hypothetical protein
MKIKNIKPLIKMKRILIIIINYVLIRDHMYLKLNLQPNNH